MKGQPALSKLPFANKRLAVLPKCHRASILNCLIAVLKAILFFILLAMWQIRCCSVLYVMPAFRSTRYEDLIGKRGEAASQGQRRQDCQGE